MLKLIVYVPENYLETVKDAMFKQGAGQSGNYDQVAWQTLGTGQFRPLAGSEPFLGSVDQVHTVAEYRLEMLCRDECLAAVIDAIVLVHPYETPAIDIIQLQSPPV